jgi:hypothetical protein
VSGNPYYYVVAATYNLGTSSPSSEVPVLPTDLAERKWSLTDEYGLYPAYPNPVRSVTTIAFNLRSRSVVSLKVFDLAGREVATLVSAELEAGKHSRQWAAENLPNGIYYYSLHAGPFTETKKLILLK